MESTIVPSQSNKYAANVPSGNFNFIGLAVSLQENDFDFTRDPEQPCHPEQRALCAAKDLNLKMLQNLKLIHLSRLPRRGALLHQLLLPLQQLSHPRPTRIGLDRFLNLRQLLLNLPSAQGIQA